MVWGFCGRGGCVFVPSRKRKLNKMGANFSKQATNELITYFECRIASLQKRIDELEKTITTLKKNTDEEV
tara:strand:- start:3368 stop:3577 length:210 start_codon:yes stop_codon:yes gene_type:complete